MSGSFSAKVVRALPVSAAQSVAGPVLAADMELLQQERQRRQKEYAALAAKVRRALKTSLCTIIDTNSLLPGFLPIAARAEADRAHAITALQALDS